MVKVSKILIGIISAKYMKYKPYLNIIPGNPNIIFIYLTNSKANIYFQYF